MNNFLLNNTSVYLGGQCQWDIVLNKKEDNLEIGGFQLSPISNNIPYNRKGDISVLNDNHSDTFKKYCTTLKESFWNTTTSPTSYEIGDNQYIEYDQSLLAGLKRSLYFDIYKKQFCFFQPIWIESLPVGSYLRFRFTVYPSENPNSILGARTLDVKLTTDSDGEREDSFHNDFVNYLNDWFDYLKINQTIDSENNIINKGNDRVMYVDLKNQKSSLSGVSTKTGQLNNNVNCDYVISNLLLYERPNIEGDYILSTLFKTHNLVASQLFNFNFHIDLEDILDSFLIRQLYGLRLYMRCDVYLVSDVEIEKLESRTLFTNYSNIKKSEYSPFLFLADYDFVNNKKNYNEEPLSGTEINTNVLNYLKDYQVPSIQDINKLTQNICHWNYTNKREKNFNLYDGYKYIYHQYNDINNISRIVTPSDPPTYEYQPLEIQYSNDISIITLTNTYNNSGELTWMYPKQIIYVDKNSFPLDNENQLTLKDIIRLYISNKGETGVLYRNSLSVDIINEAWGTNGQLPPENQNITRLACVYIKPNDESWNDIDDTIKTYFNTVTVGNNLDVCFESNMGIIFTTDHDYLLLKKVIEACKNPSENIDNDKFNEFKNVLGFLESSISKGNSGGFYQFNTEICIGQNSLNENVYYKADSHTTYLYRTSGKLSPALLTDENDELNKNYILNISDDKIQSLDKRELGDLFEVTFQNGGWRVFLSNNLSFVLSKDINDQKSLNDMIKDQLLKIYPDESNHIDDIYNLYFVLFDYEYEYSSPNNNDEEDVQITVVYKVKLILK